MTTPPVFRFSPNAYELGLFEERSGRCDACDSDRELRYTASFYAVDKPDYLCPWCVADGTAARRFKGSFNDWLGIDGVPVDPDEAVTVDRECASEVANRTPGYPSWQQERWRSHCGFPCAFLGYVDSTDITEYLVEPDFAADVDGGIGFPGEVLRDYLSRDGDLTGYLFRCVVCGAHRLHADAS
ncbi:CbrC family protein [Stackebrandtia soli]|uniref:CbrC family protein n=1 Tax=Stackebrandtia soli TaxID=1892856 RepID=UPI0039E7E36A